MSGMLFSFIFWSNFVASLECRWISLQGLLEMLESKAMWQLTRWIPDNSQLSNFRRVIVCESLCQTRDEDEDEGGGHTKKIEARGEMDKQDDKEETN